MEKEIARFARDPQRRASKQKIPLARDLDQIVLAEKEGFEPPDPWLQINGFQDRRIQPLCHFSISQFNCRKDNIFLFLENFSHKIT